MYLPMVRIYYFYYLCLKVDIDVRELTRMNKNAYSELANVIRTYPAMADVVNNVMYEVSKI